MYTHTKHLHILLTLSLFYVLQVSLLTVTLVHYIYYIYHSAMVLEVVEQLLQKHNQQGHVDVSLLAAWEQVRERKRRMKAIKRWLRDNSE